MATSGNAVKARQLVRVFSCNLLPEIPRYLILSKWLYFQPFPSLEIAKPAWTRVCCQLRTAMRPYGQRHMVTLG